LFISFFISPTQPRTVHVLGPGVCPESSVDASYPELFVLAVRICSSPLTMFSGFLFDSIRPVLPIEKHSHRLTPGTIPTLLTFSVRYKTPFFTLCKPPTSAQDQVLPVQVIRKVVAAIPLKLPYPLFAGPCRAELSSRKPSSIIHLLFSRGTWRGGLVPPNPPEEWPKPPLYTYCWL